VHVSVACGGVVLWTKMALVPVAQWLVYAVQNNVQNAVSLLSSYKHRTLYCSTSKRRSVKN
jgi:hypothetical protein